MNGSIQKRKNAWKLTVEIGRDENGKRLRRYESVKGTKGAAQARLRELLTALDKGMPIDASPATVSEFLDQWLESYVRTNTAPGTYQNYVKVVRLYLRPKLGHVPLAKLTPQHVQGLYAHMLGKGLSERTCQYAHRLLREAMSHAMKWGLIFRNVCDAVDPPRPRRKEMCALDSFDAQRLLDATAQAPHGALFFLALYSGMRRAELVALRCWQTWISRTRPCWSISAQSA